MSIQAVVIGASGYVGGELLRLIAAHPYMKLAAAVSENFSGKAVGSVFGHLQTVYRDTQFVGRDGWLDTIDSGADLALFSAAPHGAAAATISASLDAAAEKRINVHVVDCSADFRFSKLRDWESIYSAKHGAPELLGEFTCALPEHLPQASTPHIGHPGCFATASLLASVPLVQAGLCDGPLFISGVTGSTGSGRSPQAGTHHPERNSNLYAYKALQHRHAPEVAALAEAASGIRPDVSFVPHSGPFARGIHVTLQTRAAKTIDTDALHSVYVDAYRDSPFVHVVDGTPRLKNVVASNRCEIGVASNGETVAVFAAIDNLVKGAAGGAMQWMNRLWKLPETEGLTTPAPGWT